MIGIGIYVEGMLLEKYEAIETKLKEEYRVLEEELDSKREEFHKVDIQNIFKTFILACFFGIIFFVIGCFVLDDEIVLSSVNRLGLVFISLLIGFIITYFIYKGMHFTFDLKPYSKKNVLDYYMLNFNIGMLKSKLRSISEILDVVSHKKTNSKRSLKLIYFKRKRIFDKK